jgi:hypothetical protein
MPSVIRLEFSKLESNNSIAGPTLVHLHGPVIIAHFLNYNITRSIARTSGFRVALFTLTKH